MNSGEFGRGGGEALVTEEVQKERGAITIDRLKKEYEKLKAEREVFVREVGESGAYGRRIAQYDDDIRSKENEIRLMEEKFGLALRPRSEKDEAKSERKEPDNVGVSEGEQNDLKDENSVHIKEEQKIGDEEVSGEEQDLTEGVGLDRPEEGRVEPANNSKVLRDEVGVKTLDDVVKERQIASDESVSTNHGGVAKGIAYGENGAVLVDAPSKVVFARQKKLEMEDAAVEPVARDDRSVRTMADVARRRQALGEMRAGGEVAEVTQSSLEVGDVGTEAPSDEVAAVVQETPPEGAVVTNDGGNKAKGNNYTVLYDAAGNIRQVSMPNFFNRRTLSAREVEKFREERRVKIIDEMTGTGVVEQTNNNGSNREEQEKKRTKRKKFGRILAGVMLAATLFGIGKNVIAQGVDIDQRTGAAGTEKHEVQQGIIDGYDKAGLYLSSNKTAQYNFACGDDVAEITKVNGEIDECEMIKYVAKNQVESFADYLGNLPDVVKPDEYKGMTILEIEKKLEGMSAVEYKNALEDFNKIIDGAFANTTTMSGTFENAYMRPIDSSQPISHDNIELVRGTNELDNKKAIRFYWMDENQNVVGEMYAMWTCLQAGQLSNSAAVRVYDGMSEITENPEGPVTPVTPDPTPEPEPKPEPEPTPPGPTPEPEPTPPGPTPEPEPTPPGPTPEKIEEKDEENLKRIDQQILEDIAEDIGTERVVVHQETAGELTEKPTSDVYDGTEANIVQNEASKQAEVVTPSEQNNYSENRGGANAGEYAPVQERTESQQEADENEMPISEAPYSDEEWQDIVDELVSQAREKGV